MTDNYPIPLYDGNFLGLSFFIWAKPEFHIQAVETAPYQPDGSYPLVLIQFLWIEFIFDNKELYDDIYKMKHGYYPEV